MLIRASLSSAILVMTLTLSACGGGDDYDKLVSFGDSLSDVGTHQVGTVAAAGGGRWTVNSAAGGEIWTERLAVRLGVAKPCAAETGLSPNLPGISGAPIVSKPGCFGYAQGSARITDPRGPNSIALQALGQQTLGLIAKPMADQMAAHLAATGGRYNGKELVTVLAGANDVFMELAFLGNAAAGGAADGPTAVARLGAAGARLGQLVKSEIIAKGASRVLVLNVPNVAGTPFARGLDLSTPGTAALIDAMVGAFNTALRSELTGVTGVLLADAYTQSQDTSPYTNTTDVACGANALGGTSLVCNAGNLNSGDVSRYQFADDVHPSPYGQQVLADFAAREMVRAGWL